MAKHQAEEFFSIDLDSLRAGEPITFEVYLYLPANEHVIKLLHVGDRVDPAFLDRFQKRGFRLLHVRNEDHGRYMRYLAMKPVDAGPTLPTAKSAAVEESASFIPAIPPEEVFKGLLSDNVAEAEKAREQAGTLMGEILEGAPGNEILDGVGAALQGHAQSVAIYSVLFAMGVGIKDKSLLQDFVIASLLHDVGLSQIPPSVARVPMLQQNAAQKKAYDSHPLEALRVIEELRFKITPNARLLLEQHHEKFDGTGFPKKIEGFHIADHAQILGLSELIDSIGRGFYDGAACSLNEAIVKVCKIERQTTFPRFFNPDLFKKAMLWLKNGSGLDHMARAAALVEEVKQQVLGKKTA